MRGIEIIQKIGTKKYSCRVHCRFGEDRDMDLFKINGKKFFICQSLEAEAKGGDKYCGFKFPAKLKEKEIEELASSFFKFLKRK